MLTSIPSDRKTLPAMKNKSIFRNPENIDPSTIPDGWRFTLPEEHEKVDETENCVKVPFQFCRTDGKSGGMGNNDAGGMCLNRWTAITNAPLPEKYREEEIDEWHNPNKVRASGYGYRFLLKSEVATFREPCSAIEAWDGKAWLRGQFNGNDRDITYRTTLPLPAKYQKLSENKSEPNPNYVDVPMGGIRFEFSDGEWKRIADAPLDDRYNFMANKFCATVKAIELRGQWKFLRSCRLVMADNPRHGNDPSFNWDSSITFQYGKSPTAELLETGEAKWHDGVCFPLKTVRYVQP